MKAFRSPQDLALHGAPPAFDTAIHVGRPNIGSRKDFLAHVESMLDCKWLSNNGPLVQQFEAQVADYLGVKHCIAMCNGTVALEIAIRALELTGEVIVPSYTFIATAHALQWQQITPVFADINPDTHSLDPESVRKMITPRTTGIIGVHLWGRPAECQALQAVADEHGLTLLYDAAHAFGCSLQGRMIGNFGACEVLSFHATKFFNTIEGGAVVTNDDALAHKVRLMCNFGFSGFDNVIHVGTNGKMTEVCAAMGLANLGEIHNIKAVNEKHYRQYASRLAGIENLRLFSHNDAEEQNYQYIALEVQPGFGASRDELVQALHAENVLARKYFWPGCHRMQPYRDLFPRAGLLLPYTEAVADRVMVLPTGSGIDTEGVGAICDLLQCVSVHGLQISLEGALDSL